MVAQPENHDVGKRTSRILVWAGLSCTLGLAVLSLLNLAFLEFGHRGHLALNIDEIFTAVCAARGTVAGEFPVSGCHNSKGPMSFLLYQLIQPAAAPYNILTIKAAAFATIVLMAALGSWVAFRLAGIAAALVAPALMLQPLTADVQLLAFKTDTPGIVFMLGAVLLLTLTESWRRIGVLFFAGLLMGLAVATKQVYGFAAMVVILWLLVTADERGSALWRTFLVRSLIFGIGVLLPFFVFLGIFYLQDRHLEYLAGFFLYPTVYSGASEFSMVRRLIWRLGYILRDMSPSLIALSAAAVVLSFSHDSRDPSSAPRAPRQRVLVLLTSLTLLAFLLLSPMYFDYYSIPAWTFMAILGSLVIGDFLPGLSTSAPRIAAAVSAGLVAAALLPAANSWTSNGGSRNAPELREPKSVLEDSRGKYGYVLGTWPSFYFHNGLIPASAIQFPWALPGTPASWYYSPPDPGSIRGRLLTRFQERNLTILYDELRGAPPAYILVERDAVRRPDSPRLTDVPGFDDYLQQHCVQINTISDSQARTGLVFRCNAGQTSRSSRVQR